MPQISVHKLLATMSSFALTVAYSETRNGIVTRKSMQTSNFSTLARERHIDTSTMIDRWIWNEFTCHKTKCWVYIISSQLKNIYELTAERNWRNWVIEDRWHAASRKSAASWRPGDGGGVQRLTQEVQAIRECSSKEGNDFSISPISWFFWLQTVWYHGLCISW